MYQAAFDAMMSDPQMQADAKERAIEITGPVSGPDVLKIVEGLYALDPALVEKAGKAMVVTATQ